MKKKLFKTLIALIMASTVLFLMLAGCGSGDDDAAPGNGGDAPAVTDAGTQDTAAQDPAPGDDVPFGWVGAMENFQVGDTFRAAVPIELSLLYRELPEHLWSDDQLINQLMTEVTNVNFAGNTIAVLIDDFHLQRQLLIASGEAPDVMPVMYGQYVAQFVPGGAMLPISEYWHHMPHFQHFVTEWGLWDDIEWSRQADGYIYHLPGIHEDVALRFTVAMRYDVLRDLGLQVPDTWDEIRDVLRAVAAAFPGVIPYFERWTMDSTLNVAARTFDVRFGWGMGNGLILNPDTNQYEFITQRSGLRDFAEYWHSLIAEGLLDPESMIEDLAWEKFVNGDSMMLGVFWQDAPGLLNDMEENLEAGVTPGPFGIEGAEVVILPVPNGPTGMVGLGRLQNGLILNNSIREREDFIAILQFIDWLYYSEEGREFAIWGIEGRTFEWVDGERRLLPGFREVAWGGQDNTDYERMNDLGFNQNVFTATHGGSTELILSIVPPAFHGPFLANTTRIPHALNPAPPFNVLEQEEAGIFAGQLTDMVNTNIREFILGRRDFSEWDAFIAEAEASGVERLVNLANTAINRHLGN